MIDRALNLENYINWLYEIGQAIEDREIALKRREDAAWELYLLGVKSINSDGKKSNSTTKQKALELENEELDHLISGYDGIIQNHDFAQNVEAEKRGLRCFIPTPTEQKYIEELRVTLGETLMNKFSDKLKYPTRPKEQIIDSFVGDLEFAYSEFYKERIVITWLETDPIFPRNMVMFKLADDLATFDLIKNLNTGSYDNVGIEKSVFKDEEYITRFKLLMEKSGYWSEADGCKLTKKNAGSSKLSGVLLALLGIGVFKERISQQACFDEMAKIIGFTGKLAKNVNDPTYKSIGQAKERFIKLYNENFAQRRES
jgi:hypothetical protein